MRNVRVKAGFWRSCAIWPIIFTAILSKRVRRGIPVILRSSLLWCACTAVRRKRSIKSWQCILSMCAAWTPIIIRRKRRRIHGVSGGMILMIRSTRSIMRRCAGRTRQWDMQCVRCIFIRAWRTRPWRREIRSLQTSVRLFGTISPGTECMWREPSVPLTKGRPLRRTTICQTIRHTERPVRRSDWSFFPIKCCILRETAGMRTWWSGPCITVCLQECSLTGRNFSMWIR